MLYIFLFFFVFNIKNTKYNKYSPTGYGINNIAGLCSNGFHNDAHVLLWIIRNNIGNYTNLFPASKNIMGIDRGYKQLLLDKNSERFCNALCPSFIRTNPVPTLDSNLSRETSTKHRFIIEKAIGHYKAEWFILNARIASPAKQYIDRVQKVLMAVNNFK